MTETELLQTIAAGEGSQVEFKRDGIRPEQLAREIVSFANMNGGRVLLGVEDNGAISGVRRPNPQEWLMDTVIGRYVTPQIVPDYEEITVGAARVSIIGVPMGAAKPYAVQNGDRQEYYLRYGNVCRLATREQMLRLFESGGLLAVEKLPIHGSTLEELDARRLEEYFHRILGDEIGNWHRTLLNRDLLVESGSAQGPHCSYAGYALFALQPRRRLPQAGLRLMVFPRTDMDYNASLDEVLDLPCVGLGEQKPGRFVEQSLPERALSYLQPHISEEHLTGTIRRRHWDYPQEVIRELLVNALAHRDWTRQNDIRLVVFRDRMEITSPGALPNGMTIEKIRSGQQAPRNTNMVRVLRDYGMMDDRGMGIRRMVIPLMREENGSEPEFEATEDYFKVTLQRRLRTWPCPIPGCRKVFRNSRSGWDAHVASLRKHPDWHPDIRDPRTRKDLFRSDFSHWFED